MGQVPLSIRVVRLRINSSFKAFHVAYVFIRMANSPRPGIWALEKSTDYGQTFTPWQYFADTPRYDSALHESVFVDLN